MIKKINVRSIRVSRLKGRLMAEPEEEKEREALNAFQRKTLLLGYILKLLK